MASRCAHPKPTMLLPLEYSMTLWWVATPQWGFEPDPDASAQVAEVIDEIDTLDATAPRAPPPARFQAPVPVHRVVTGYTWSAEPHWEQVQGPLYERFVANQRHDAERHRSDRVRLIPTAEYRPADGALWDRAGFVCSPIHSESAARAEE
jgi:hypothetical protein